MSFQVAAPKLRDKILLGTWTYAKGAALYPGVSLSNENLRAKEDGKEETGEAHFALLLFHGPLLFVTSHSGFALPSAPEQEPVPRD